MKISPISTHRSVPLSFLAALILGLTNFAKAQDTSYVWVSSDGNPYDFHGTIVLNSDLNAGGSLADIVSVSLSGNGTVPLTISGTQIVADGGASDGTFSWTPTEITSMEVTDPDINGLNPESPGIFGLGASPANNNEGYQVDYTNYLNGQVTLDPEGEWLATPVPEPGHTGMVFGSTSVAVISVSVFAAGLSNWRRKATTQPCPIG